MITANPCFAAWNPFVSLNCSDSFASLFCSSRQSLKIYLRFLVKSICTVNRKALSHLRCVWVFCHSIHAKTNAGPQWAEPQPLQLTVTSRANPLFLDPHTLHTSVHVYIERNWPNESSQCVSVEKVQSTTRLSAGDTIFDPDSFISSTERAHVFNDSFVSSHHQTGWSIGEMRANIIVKADWYKHGDAALYGLIHVNFSTLL